MALRSRLRSGTTVHSEGGQSANGVRGEEGRKGCRKNELGVGPKWPVLGTGEWFRHKLCS